MNPTGPVRILHLEDDANDAELVQHALRRGGMKFEIARVANRTDFAAAVTRGDFDLILADYTLPAFSGEEALRIVKAVRPGIPYIFVSGTIGEERAVECVKAGARDYVLKRRLERLPELIERALKEEEQIRERRNAEMALRQSEERFRQLTENINQVFFLVDIEKRELLYASPAYEKIWGRSCASLYANPASWVESIVLEDREKVQGAREAALRGGGFDEEFRVARPDGETRWVHGRAFPVLNEAGQIYRFAGVGTDITDRKRLESQVLRAQRLDSIGTLASGIAHDLNNALAPILMAAEMLRDQSVDEEARSMLEVVHASASRGAEMVRHLLTFARGIEGKHQSLAPIRIIQEMETILRKTFPKNIRVQTEVKALANVQGDATQIHQILLNLCVNARDAMPSGGTLTIRAENFTVDEHFAKMTVGAKAGQYVVISVTDTGTGMAAEIRDRIFEPFFSTKSLDVGTGLGLATVRGIVKSHGGFISVYSELGRGSEFRVYLPTCEEKHTNTERVSRELPAGNGELILVVDDEEAIRSLTQRALEAFNYKVITAGNGAEGIAAFAREVDTIDLVLTDMAMPVMDGKAFILALRVLDPTVKVIAASGLAESFGPVKVGTEVPNAFVHKPYTAEKLVRTIRRVLDGESDAPTAMT